MTTIETLQLGGFVLIAAALLILAGTAAAILYRRRTDELEAWVAEQDQAAEQTHTAVVSPRPVSVDDTMTRPLEVPVPVPCGRTEDHPAHFFIDYVENPDNPHWPDMRRRPCVGVRSGPHRRRI